MKSIVVALMLVMAAGSSALAKPPKTAKSELSLFTRHDGSPGFPNVNWYLRNNSSSQRITATIRFTQSGKPPWTTVFTLAPGEERGVGTQSGGMGGSIGAGIAGAFYN